jgi:DNA-binding winged helix-turn-helix (wHTH) protein/Flp pilus assembly protein TadD
VPPDPSPAAGRVRFGEFEVDLRSHELLRAGRRVHLQEKSFLVLNELIQCPGELVTREALVAALWPKEYFVDAEHGLNTAVRRLREALGDSAGEARYVETLPKLGYRFIAALESPSGPDERALPVAPPGTSESEPLPRPPAAEPSPPSAGSPPELAAPRKRRRIAVIGVGALVAAALAILLGPRWRFGQPGATSAPAATKPGDTDVVGELLARARYLRNVKRFEEAKRFVEEALRIDPTSADAVGALALSQIVDEQDERARETAKRALELDPTVAEAHRALAVLERGAGNLEATERHLRLAVDADAEDVRSRNRLARHLLECGRFEEARQRIVEARRFAPDDPDVQNIWLEYALRTGDYESAIREGESWIAIWAEQIGDQPTALVRDMLGLAYVGARRREEALAQFRAIDADDDLRVALTLAHLGSASEARAILAAHESAPGAASDPGLDGAMAMAFVVLGDFDRAFERLDRQLAARWYPGWLNGSLFESIRRDSRWTQFVLRLEREFSRAERKTTFPARTALLQSWPRPARRPPPTPAAS